MAKISHRLQVVSDLDSSVAWYERYAGLRVIHRRTRPSGQLVAWIGSSPGEAAHLICVQGPDPEPATGPYGHLGVSTRDIEEFRALLAVATADGVLERGPDSQPWPICDWFSLLDPDGNRVEVSFGQDEVPADHAILLGQT